MPLSAGSKLRRHEIFEPLEVNRYRFNPGKSIIASAPRAHFLSRTGLVPLDPCAAGSSRRRFRSDDLGGFQPCA
jgi:hypothetical protein